jgi:dynactin 1
MDEIKVGQTVELADGRVGIVRYVGQPHFAAGDWVGVELDDNSGKNDGSVQGERYFECELGRGMFLRPAAIAIVAQPAPSPSKPAVAAPKPVRPTSSALPAAGKRASIASDPTASKRMSVNAASPTPPVRPLRPPSRPSSTLRSPTKSPTKQLASGGSSITSTPRTGTPSNGRVVSVAAPKPRPSVGTSRTSMGPPPIPATRGSRQSISTTSSTSATRFAPPKSSSAVSSRPSLAARQPGKPLSSVGRLPSVSSLVSSAQVSEGSDQENGDEDGSASPVLSDQAEALSPKPTSPVLSRTSANEQPTALSTTSARSATSPVAQRNTTGTTAATNREVEDLKTKMRLLEKKRMDDRDKLKALEQIKAERDKFESIIQKLQAKYQPQQQEITELRKQLREAQSKFEEIENMQADHDVVIEMATLDREMAEETAEVLKTELEALKQKAEELELEVEVLREENAELSGEMSPEEKASQGWLQMERNNERLREALLRLRDMTQQQEAELRDQIKSLEEDVRELRGVKEQYEFVKEKLAQSEASIEDLRQQLDTALGAEDMIEELTEKNMSMSEQIEELKAVVDDLESLKELNDELEVNHVETEKEMQEDLDFKDTVIAEQARRAAQQEEVIEDMEYTLSKFRELVTSLQTDIEDMRASHTVSETESVQLESRSRAMLDLNLKLQSTVAKAQVKTIDLELRRLDAQEASDHLAIVQLFLPEAYSADKDSVLALLRFKRVEFKANLLHTFIRERVNSPSTHGESELFAACEALDRLTWVSAMCDRFISAISHCSIEQFAKFEGAMYELEPVERALNGWIDGLRRDELKEHQCASELQRTIALMSHLAEVHIPEGVATYADDVHMRALVMQSHLENTAAALAASKAMVQERVPATGDDEELAIDFVKKADAVITHVRNAKVIVGKTVRALEDLKTRSLSLPQDTIDKFEQCENGTQELASYSRRLGEDLSAVLYEESRTEPFTHNEIHSIIYRTTTSTFQTSDSDILSTFSSKLRSLTTSLANLATLSSDLSNTVEFERPTSPWVIRAELLKSSRIVPVDTAEELRRLKDESHERARLIALRDQTLEENAVKIELLGSRMRDAAKKNELIAELEGKIEDAKKRSTELEAMVETQSREMVLVEQEKERWKKVAGDVEKRGEVEGRKNRGLEVAVATAREMENLKDEIAGLQAAVRYLRDDNRRMRLSEPQNWAWLEAPLMAPPSQDESRKELVVQEGNDVLAELLNLAASAKVYDLSKVPKDRLAWRPAKSTPGWHVAKQREDYESWRSWQRTVTLKVEGLTAVQTARQRKRLKPLARVELLLPQTEKAGLGGGEVEVVEAADFNSFRGRLGIV